MSEARPERIQQFAAKAVLLGQRIDLRALALPDPLAAAPLTVALGAEGTAVLFRYGAVVLYGVDPDREAGAFLASVQAFTDEPFDTPEVEAVEIRIRPDGREQVEGNVLYLHDAGVPRLQIVAEVLARSTVLARHEARIADSFRQVQPVAEHMQGRRFPRRAARDLIRHVGEALLSQHMMLGHAEVMDRPELLWENPGLEKLYNRLEEEYEIRDRHQTLRSKLDLIHRTAQTSLEMLQDARTLRVEWYIVILIVVEIVISLYELFIRGRH